MHVLLTSSRMEHRNVPAHGSFRWSGKVVSTYWSYHSKCFNYSIQPMMPQEYPLPGRSCAQFDTIRFSTPRFHIFGCRLAGIYVSC
jgi:hypothetical protein